MDSIIEGFKAACLFVGVSYFLPGEYEGNIRLLMQFAAALTGYFGYLAYLKKQKQEWKTKEIVVGIFASAIAMWVLVILKILINLIYSGTHPAR